MEKVLETIREMAICMTGATFALAIIFIWTLVADERKKKTK
jgi:hypothetical protein